MAQKDTRKRVAFYLRVSTKDQNADNQLAKLEAAAERLDWNVVNIFRDDGISGAKSRAKRPGFDDLCKGVARREFALVAVWSLDRLGRSLRDLILFLDDLNDRKVDLFVGDRDWDTSTPSGKFMFSVFGALAEFERGLISERVRAGQARTTKRIGRPPTISDETRAAIKKAYADSDGNGMRKIARDFGVSHTTVARLIADE